MFSITDGTMDVCKCWVINHNLVLSKYNILSRSAVMSESMLAVLALLLWSASAGSLTVASIAYISCDFNTQVKVDLLLLRRYGRIC